MKNQFIKKMVLATFILSAAIFQTGCSKDDNTPAPTPTPVPALTKEQILTQKIWRIAQLHHVISGVYSSYILGGANSTGIDYDKLRFTFKADGAGTLIDQNGISFTTTWQFTTSDKRNLEIKVNGGLTYTWQMVQIADNYLNSSVQLTVSGNANNVETQQLVQIP